MRRILVPVALLPLAGCEGIQSMTGGQGADGALFNQLFILFLVVTGAVFAAVMLFLGAALLRRRGQAPNMADAETEPSGGERKLARLLTGWAVFIAIGLAGLTIASWFTDRQTLAATGDPALEITVTARQWWWQVDYAGVEANQGFTTANEIHLPVGVPVHVTLRANDVIHSFWIPNLAGKQDMIPGRQNDIILRPTAEGRYRGQCAEFCGLQHAHMAFDVVVESPQAFAAWRAAQLAPAPPPSNPLQQAGYDYVTTRECSSCHTIAGTPASGRVGPDLTHLATRRSIGAGTFPMSRGHLYAWIADPQGAKPGNQMPYVGLEPAELHAVVAYLETLR